MGPHLQAPHLTPSMGTPPLLQVLDRLLAPLDDCEDRALLWPSDPMGPHPHTPWDPTLPLPSSPPRGAAATWQLLFYGQALSPFQRYEYVAWPGPHWDPMAPHPCPSSPLVLLPRGRYVAWPGVFVNVCRLPASHLLRSHMNSHLLIHTSSFTVPSPACARHFTLLVHTLFTAQHSCFTPPAHPLHRCCAASP
jgi:hypothetical protein